MILLRTRLAHIIRDFRFACPSSPWLKGEKGSTRSILRTTLPHGHESTQGPGTDTRIVDRDERVAGHGRASVLSAVESGPGHARVRRVCRGAMRPVLRRDSRPSKSAAGDLLPAAVDWVLRGDRFGARDCLAHRGFAALLRKSKLAPSAPTRRFVTDRSRTTLVDQARSFD